MLAPEILPSGAKLILMNFPKRLELLFRWVCAFPKDSRTGLAWMICRSNRPSRSLAVVVLPDPVIDILLFLLLGNPIDGIAEYEEDMDGECA